MKAGWEEKTLGDVCEIQSGYAFKSSEYVDAGHFLVRISNVQHGKLTEERPKFVELGESTLRFELNEGDILTSLTGNIGRVARVEYSNLPAALNQRVARIHRCDLRMVQPEYLYRLLSSRIFGDALRAKSHGAAQQNVSPKEIAGINLPIPPLAEQKQIVSVLDQSFAGIERAAEAARKNRDNARELFETTLNATFTQKGEDWVETTLGEVCEFKNGLNFTKSSKGQKIKIVGVRDFQSNFEIPVKNLETAQIDGELSEAYEMRAGDILTVRSNGNKQLIGRCMLAPPISEVTSHSGFTIRIRVIDQRLSPKFLTHYLKSSPVRNMLISSGEGANISSLNQKALSSLPAHFPDLETQEEIITKIENTQDQTQHLETLCQQKLDALDELKQSLLQKAFAGELTADFNAAEAEADLVS